MNRSVVMSGCSGGGKSTLLTELGRRGYPVVEEPGHRIVAEQMRSNGMALSWIDISGDAVHDVVRFVSSPINMVGTGWVGSAATHLYLGRTANAASARLGPGS